MHSAILETGKDWNQSKGGDYPPSIGRSDPDTYIISANKNQIKPDSN